MDNFNPLALIMLVLLIILIRQVKSLKEKANSDALNLNEKLNDLKNTVEKLRSVDLQNTKSEEVLPEKSLLEEIIQTPEETELKAEPEEIIRERVVFENEQREVYIEQPAAFSDLEMNKAHDSYSADDSNNINTVKEKHEPKISWITKFKNENPDLEKFIGENLINKIGILILVLGISFFVKYAIDRDWINEPQRVGIGVLAGALVMGIAHRLKTNYKAFSSVFVAGAFAIFYFTIAIAFQEYHLFSQTVAFAIMVVITIFSALISISYNRQELGVLSLIAGFSVPFMIASGSGNYVVLFSYIAILNVGMLIISYFKKWNLVNLLAFIFTCGIFTVWWLDISQKPNAPHSGALIFAILFYLIFSISTVINNLRSSGTFSKIQYVLIIINTFFILGLGMSIIESWKLPLKGAFTVGLGIYNLGFASVVYRKFKLNKNAIYLLTGLSLSLATLTIPIQFQGNYITLFWACEAVLLFFLAQKSKIAVFKISALLVQIFMLCSLLMDWLQAYNDLSLSREYIHSVFLTGIIALTTLLYTYYLLKKESEIYSFYGFKFNPATYRKLIFAVSIITGYIVGVLELDYQTFYAFDSSSTRTSFVVAYHFIFSAFLIYFIFKRNSLHLRRFATLLGMVNVLLFTFLFWSLPTDDLTSYYFDPVKSTFAYLLHLLILASTVFTLYFIVKSTLQDPPIKKLHSKFALWLLLIIGVSILSEELLVQVIYFGSSNGLPENWQKLRLLTESDAYLIMSNNFISYVSDLQTQVYRVGFPILWGIISFILLLIGVKKDLKHIRIMALSLLGITVLKLFLVDINDASETGKIIAFILLGVLILVISFVYQKLKKLVSDEPKKNDEDEKVL